ncbi:MAG: caspase family protein, partial [Cyanobacteria bacterium J06632_3]
MGSKPSENKGLSRRAFFQKTGAVVTALGLAELSTRLGIPAKAKDYSQALAETKGRKLALLVGIDKYPDKAIPEGQETNGLAGCVTDVMLQKMLLIHRFGFLPEDIVCLTNEAATREGIYQAFADHLIDQAKPGDAVVFHFSGYGAQVRIADLVGGQATQRSLVPVDGLLPTEKRPTLHDISEIELKGLLKQLKTKNVTTVLDAGFMELGLPLSGGLRSRTRSALVTGQLPAPFPKLTNQRSAKES